MPVCTCCMCLNKFEGEEPPILMMDHAGNPRVLCPACTGIVDAIAGTPDSPERDAAIATLRGMDIKNPTVAFELAKLIDRTDAPLDEADAWESEEELAEEEPPVPEVVNGSNLSLYLGLGCIAAALILFLLLRFIL